MSSPHSEITHVSDTALMVAACRALETECDDGFVHDPFARRLAGEHGMALLNAIPRREILRFGVGVRSRFLDELILETVPQVATVLSVGCGLDTRPWRLDLSPDLRWIEVDFDDMLNYKDSLLSEEKPRCRRERLTTDVNDPVQRQAMFNLAGSSPTLMITEGLLMYLPAASVNAIAVESRQNANVTHWMMDIASSAFAHAIGMASDDQLRRVQADDFLHGEGIVETLARHRWKSAARRSYLTDLSFATARVERMFGSRPVDAPPPPVFPPDDPSGVHRFVPA